MDLLKIKKSPLQQYMLTGAVFALNFFCAAELFFNSGQIVEPISVVGGIFLFGLLSIHMMKRRRTIDIKKPQFGIEMLRRIVDVHVIVTLLLYLTITMGHWL